MVVINSINSIIRLFEHLNFDNKDSSLLVLDIDNTIIKSEFSLGSDQWYTWQYELTLQNHIHAISKDHNGLNSIIEHMYANLNYQLCESQLPDILSKLKKKNVTIILQTARSKNCHFDLKKTCQKLGIFQYLDYQSLSLKSLQASFMEGIIYCSGGSKGDILKLFLNQNNLLTNELIFIDDKLKNLYSVHACLPKCKLFLMTNQFDTIKKFEDSDKSEVIQEYEKYLCLYSKVLKQL